MLKGTLTQCITKMAKSFILRFRYKFLIPAEHKHTRLISSVRSLNVKHVVGSAMHLITDSKPLVGIPLADILITSRSTLFCAAHIAI